MPHRNDREDRNEALRLFVAVIGAGAVLLVVLILGGYLLFDWFAGLAGPLDDGLGLRRAAIIAAVVSFLVATVLAMVSGGGILFGELPFVIVGFFLFFVFFWLMLAWIF